MSSSNSKSQQSNILVDELVLDKPWKYSNLFPDNEELVKQFAKATKDSFAKSNAFRTGAACMYNLFHYGPNGIMAMKSLNDVPGGRGPTESWGSGEGGRVMRGRGDPTFQANLCPEVPDPEGRVMRGRGAQPPIIFTMDSVGGPTEGVGELFNKMKGVGAHV